MTEYCSYAIYTRQSSDWRWLAGGFATQEDAIATLQAINDSNAEDCRSNVYKITKIIANEYDVQTLEFTKAVDQ